MSDANYRLEPVRLTMHGSGGIELAADQLGPAEGPLVVLLHGGGQTRHSWKQTGAKLAAAGMRVVAVDCRGHGDSQWAEDGDYRRDAMVADLLLILEQLGAPAVVVGASMGGLTGLLATATAGSAINALVLVDIVTRPESSGTARVVNFLGKHRDGFDTLEQAADAVAEYLPHRSRPKSPEGLRRNLRRRADGRWYWHWDPAILDQRVEGEDLDQALERLEDAARALTIPVLLVRGTQSDVVSAEAAAEFHALVPHAQFVEIGGAAHTAAGDDNDAFTEAIAKFVLAAAGEGSAAG